MSSVDLPLLPSRRLSVAPMLDWTDRHCRYFHRLLTKQAWLYTEMVTTGALLHGKAARFLAFDATEHPVALQLGGSDPVALAKCAKMAEAWGYNEVNLNVGCPSERVQSGAFGACLMREADLVAECLAAMQAAVSIPVTIKHRIGVDNDNRYEMLADFVRTIVESGCRVFVIHARNAILKGLSPKENREIPPLNYPWVARLKQDFPQLTIVVNGGIKTDADIAARLMEVDGVMVGREAYHNPYSLATWDSHFVNANTPIVTRAAVVHQMIPYIERAMTEGSELKHIARHLLGLYQGCRGAKHWRRSLSDPHCLKEGIPMLLRVLSEVEAEAVGRD